MTPEGIEAPATFEMSESITKLMAALVKAQSAMGSAVKGANNTYYKSKYADLTEVIETCKEALNAEGICFLQPLLTGAKGVCVRTFLGHTSGEFIAATVDFPVAKIDSQEYGKAVSYARRYSLQSLLSIPAEDDDGNAAAGKKVNPYTAAMLQDMPPDTLLCGVLLGIDSPLAAGEPATARFQLDNGMALSCDVVNGEEAWHELAGQAVELKWTKKRTRWVLVELRPKSIPGRALPANPKPQLTPPSKTVARLREGLQLGLVQEAKAVDGKGMGLKLALKDGDVEACTLLKPAKVGAADWSEVVGTQLYFKLAPKDPTKIIDLVTEEAYANVEGATS